MSGRKQNTRDDSGSGQKIRIHPSACKRYLYNNAYVNYLTEFLKKPESKRLGSHAQLFKIAGQQWREMNEDQRTPYQISADYNKSILAKYRAKYPNKPKKKLKRILTCQRCGHMIKVEKKRATVVARPATPSFKESKRTRRSQSDKRDMTFGRKAGLRRATAGIPPSNEEVSVDDLFESEEEGCVTSVSSF